MSFLRALSTLMLALVVGLPGYASAAIFTVTNTNTSGAGSLAKAIADANLTTDPDTINFNITSATPVLTIGGTLPAITQPVTIDGYSQPGTSKNTSVIDTTNAVLRIEIDASATPVLGAAIKIAAGSTIKGIAIKNIPSKSFGIEISGDETSTVKGCFIGTGAGGTTDLSAGLGIIVRSTANIGGPTNGDRNLISANDGAGVQLKGTGMALINNLIGIDKNGNPLGNGTGVLISAATLLSSIGGPDEATRNVIAGNNGPGVRVLATAAGAAALGANHFFANSGLAVDLGTDGVTPNDEGDLDTGPNGLQNYPEITFALINPGNLHLEGFLDSKPGAYIIGVWRNDEADPTGFGEGEDFVDTFDVEIPEGENVVEFSVDLPLGLGQNGPTLVTMTAQNNSDSATSEFSRAVATVAGGQELVVTNTNDSGVGSLRQAILTANGTGQPATVVFDIPGDAPHTILTTSTMKVTVPIVIDGYSQPGSAKNTLEVGTNAVPGIFLDGSQAPANTKIQLQIDGSNSVIRGVGFQNSVGTALVVGSGVSMADPVVEGCFFGVDPNGLLDRGTGGNAIVVGEGTARLAIGGPQPSQRNLISGNGAAGIFDAGQGTGIFNNLIGVDATGLANLGNEGSGLFLQGNKTVVGGDDPALANVIRGNGDAGITVAQGQAEILGNSIADNGFLGIDLIAPDSVEPELTNNDADDGDSGPNGLQNFPEIVSESILPGSAKFEGVLDVPANFVDVTYTLRFFDNESCDESGHGEGAVFLGAAEVLISGDSEGFLVNLPVTLGDTHIVTATATAPNGDTSEFSECFGTFEPPSACGDANADTNITAGDGQLALKTAVGSAQCDLCRCDVNLSNTVSTSDALLMLKAGVGQQVQLQCPPCN